MARKSAPQIRHKLPFKDKSRRCVPSFHSKHQSHKPSKGKILPSPFDLYKIEQSIRPQTINKLREYSFSIPKYIELL
ncbi:hypothetical protein NHP190002_12720 [Helicobacter ailurogastricus]|nr:hypothetical protein NHP190002_12720 [Helicobacter ailurogastricus]